MKNEYSKPYRIAKAIYKIIKEEERRGISKDFTKLKEITSEKDMEIFMRSKGYKAKEWIFH